MAHVYDNHFQAYTDASSRHTAQRVTTFLRDHLAPDSVLDVGCARGGWLAAWQQAGAGTIHGLDGDYVERSQLAIPQDAFTSADLSGPVDLGRQFDLVQSLEVAEHIPPDSAETFVANLVRHSRGLVLFSAAPPGQGGEFHVNERPYDYWRGLFAGHGFSAYDPVRPFLAGDRAVSFWYRYNILLYVHAGKQAALPAALAATRVPDGQPVPDVSPLPFRLRKQAVRLLPYPLQQGLARLKARLRA